MYEARQVEVNTQIGYIILLSTWECLVFLSGI